jgi:hypothetical protein
VGVIELRPQIAIVPQEPIEKSQPFSVPLRIENSGYFSFWLEHAFCYYHEVRVGPIHVSKGTSHTLEWNRHSIDRAEGETIVCNLARSPSMPANADIAVVVDYRPWRIFPWTFRRCFRFTGMYVDNWQWTQQPSEPIQADAYTAVDDHMKQIPRSR